MQRLLRSSKFWASVMGLVALIIAALVGPDQVADGAEKAIPIFAMIAPIVFAVLTAFEDFAEKIRSGEIDLSSDSAFREFLMELIKEVLDALQNQDEDEPTN